MTIDEGRYTPAAERSNAHRTPTWNATKGSACRYVDTLFPHPYLAFVHHANPPCGLPMVNNVGPLGHYFPAVKRTDRYVVLVTGGSVASQLVGTPISRGSEGEQPAVGPNFLQRELNQHYVSPNGKPFLVLNGGDGAEAAAAVHPVLHVRQRGRRRCRARRLQRALSVQSRNRGDARTAVQYVPRGGSLRGRREFRRRRDRLGNGPTFRILAQNPIPGIPMPPIWSCEASRRWPRARTTSSRASWTTLNSIFAMPKEICEDNNKAFALQLEHYRKYARGIDIMAKDHGVKSVFFLQPIPAIGKMLTEEEKRVVGDLSNRDTTSASSRA